MDTLTDYVVGAGRIERDGAITRLILDNTSTRTYSDSQLDDFHMRARRDYFWRPPVTLSLRARFSHPADQLRGTAGFGWWNAPFARDRATIAVTGPQVLWFFFASPPNHLSTTGTFSGQGWFAQMLNVSTLPRLAAWAGSLLVRPLLRGIAQRSADRAGRGVEQSLSIVDITEWHNYRIEWEKEIARFYVDNILVMTAPHPPTSPLALVLWIDNQWADLRGRGGLLAIEESQWMEIADLNMEHGT